MQQYPIVGAESPVAWASLVLLQRVPDEPEHRRPPLVLPPRREGSAPLRKPLGCGERRRSQVS